ncbi:glycosyltransferase [Pseudohongiella sp. SYSU M77423]|uniref:glycosyltransferase n=1 Tax=Pseudohongiella sp. SYSU M77423 TaxID=3042312 RepID=UPI002480DDCA|nr:glycosyltransferase [Pseudohongiella sp. SYSU M77423]MDH7944932.1 glycosyltransferase [Pseudohongiella sp. SYSU M77423]
MTKITTMTETEFDVVIVCFNDDDRLKVTIDSLIKVGFRNQVIVQDGSMLESTRVYLKAMEKYLNIDHVQTQDSGLYHAMNLAARRVRRDYFLTLNCGDLLLLPVLPAVNQFSLAFCAVQIEFVQKNKQSHVYIPQITFMHQRMACCHQGAIIKKTLFQQLGGYDLTYKIAADYDFMLKAISYAPEVIVLKDIEIVRFQGDGGMSERFRFVLEMETARIKNNYFSSSLPAKLLNYIVHSLRYIKFRFS